MKVDVGDGDPDGDGAVYTVAGSSGKLTTGTAAVFGGTEPTHPVHLSSLFVHGSVALEIDGNRLDARFLDATGAVQDRYTIFKGGVTVPPGADFAATPLVAAPGVPIGFVDLTTNQPTSWGWDFDDDGAVDSNRPAPSNSYAQTGIYTVSLAVSNSAGADQHVKSGYICITGGVPLEITNLLLHADGTIAWEIEPDATSYAVVKGDLVQVRVSTTSPAGATAFRNAGPSIPPDRVRSPHATRHCKDQGPSAPDRRQPEHSAMGPEIGQRVSQSAETDGRSLNLRETGT